MFGIPPRLPIGLGEVEVVPSSVEIPAAHIEGITQAMSERSTRLNETHPKLIANVEKAQDRQVKEYAERRKTSTSLPPIGTLVWVRQDRSDGPSSGKQKKKDIGSKTQGWLGPFRLIGYSADNSRGIIEAPGSNGKAGKQWTEAWKDIKIKRKKASSGKDGSALGQGPNF
jgi:hypothetical protein